MQKMYLSFRRNLSVGLLVCLFCITGSSYSYGVPIVEDWVKYVDPYIGSGGHGHVFVGASVPFGMIQAGPQNIHKGWDWCSGYHYSDSVLIGFSHTHLSGTGCADMGDILVMPFTGPLRTQRGEQDRIDGSCSSYYSHENEEVSPGYYSLLLDNGIQTRLTATDRVALHQYTYPSGQTPRLLINLKEGNGDQAYDTYLKKTDDYTIKGYRFSKGWSPKHKVFFVLKSSCPINTLDVFNDDQVAGSDELSGEAVKGVITFKDNPSDVRFKLALSSVSMENAWANMEQELPDWDFERVRQAARNRWSQELSCVAIESDDERSKRIFYTALYHTMICPTLYCDVNGQFRGHDDKIYTADWTNYSTFSLWDTYRALHPMFTILKSGMVGDFVNSMLSIYDQQGKLPIWPLVGGETNQMPGYSSIPVVADASLKGFTGFDRLRAYEAVVGSSTHAGQVGVPYVMKNGYIPCDRVGEATSVAMEYAVGDWGIARMAKQLGKIQDHETFLKRGKYYSQYFDKQINFVRPRLESGEWAAPYDPFNAVHGGKGYFCEGNGWHYTFFVPQHPEGLISLMGGDQPFTSKLDSLFMAKGDMGPHASADISGLIGMYAHGNEPSHHIAYLYPYAGEQWKTAEKVRYIQREFYTDGKDGIIGNEDCGQMSAWHILSALGFYQVSPSDGLLVFGSPLFKRAEINLPGGKRFVVNSENNSDSHIYIQSVLLNGKPYEKSYLLYKDLMAGGSLTFIMGDSPSSFGKAPENRPYTIE